MSEILATNKELSKIIDNAVKRIGENHSLSRDSKGVEMNSMEIEKDRLKFRKGRISEGIDVVKERGTTIDNALKEAADEIAENMVLENTIGGMVKDVISEQNTGFLDKSYIKPLTQKGYVEVDTIDLPDGKYTKGGGGYKIEIKTEDGNPTGYMIVTNSGIRGMWSGPINIKGGKTDDDYANDYYKIMYNDEEVEEVGEPAEQLDVDINESTRNTIKKLIKKKLKEGWSKKSMPGYEKYLEVEKDNNKIHKEYEKDFKKKFKDYSDFEGNDNPEFPHSENSKSSEGYEKYENTTDDEEFIDDFAYPGLQDFDVHNQDMDRLAKYLEGSSETGNAQTNEKGEALGNVVPSELGSKILKSKKRRKEKIDAQNASKTNLRGYTPDIQKVKQVKEDVKSDMKDMKKLWGYNKKTQ